MFSEQINALAQDIIQKASAKNLMVSTVESCTGGLIAATLTDISGSSACVAGGLITYSNQLKTKLADVQESTLSAFGAVSEETALEMAKGGKNSTQSNITISVTGVAGPTGGSPEKPVGTVWFGIASDHHISAEKHMFSGTRTDVRTQTVQHALTMIQKEITRNY